MPVDGGMFYLGKSDGSDDMDLHVDIANHGKREIEVVVLAKGGTGRALLRRVVSYRELIAAIDSLTNTTAGKAVLDRYVRKNFHIKRMED